MEDVVFCISGPSGVGKGSLVRELVRTDPTIALSVSCTTRAPRPGETHGVEYFFVSREEFEKGIAEGAFIEYDEHFGNYYGTPRSYVRKLLAEKKSVILEIDVVGTLNVKACHPKEMRVVAILIVPPSDEALSDRLRHRGSETEEQLALRRERVAYELGKAKEYDYVVVNDVFVTAVEEIRAIIKNEINRK